jgi:hypothetical protein
MKIKQLAEDLKAIGLKHDWAMITATQTTRSQYDTSDMTGAQVAESSGLNATVDAMFGIIADSFMKARGEYYLKCLYDRVAPEDNKRKKYLNDKTFLRITEDISSPIEDLTGMDIGGSPNFQRYANNKTQNNNYGSTTQYVPQAATQQGVTSMPMLSDSLEASGKTVTPKNNTLNNGIVSVTGSGLF